jgi:peptide deformylase
MILPIYTYGNDVLLKVAQPIQPTYENLPELVTNMWDTMYNASGVGLAAPQIGLPIRLFVIDTTQKIDDDDEPNTTPPQQGLKKVFINAQKITETGKPNSFEEGCLSIPGIRGDVERLSTITIQYLDEQFQQHTETFSGFNARVIQHEYDHLEGILFTELLKPLKKRFVRPKLEKMKQGQVYASYKIRPPKLQR